MRELKTDDSDLTLSDDESGLEIDVEIEMLFTSDDSSVSSDEQSKNNLLEGRLIN